MTPRGPADAVPDLQPGLNLINTLTRDSSAFHQLVHSELREREGLAYWVDARNNASTYLLADLETVAAEISAAVDIRLEYESAYDWICFVPKRESSIGALTKYFGKKRGEDVYKVRGIEIRQRSTPTFIERAQRQFMDTLDRHREPESVVEVCQRLISELRAGKVNSEGLVIRKRVSKPLEAYSQEALNVAALARYREHGIDKRPGQDVRYVVVDDEARRTPERVQMSFEVEKLYDSVFYGRGLIRACESILSPIGWDRRKIRRQIRNSRDLGLSVFERDHDHMTQIWEE